MSRFKIGRKRTDDMWDDSWDVEEPPTLYLEPSSDGADDGYMWTDRTEQDGEVFISWRLVGIVLVVVLFFVILISGIISTHYTSNGQAILATPAYRSKVQYAKTVSSIWTATEQVEQHADTETRSYIQSNSNPFVLSQDMTKDAATITRLQVQLEKLKVPTEYQTFQSLLDNTLTMEITNLSTESQTVISTTSPDMTTVTAEYQRVQAQQQVVDKEVSDMLTLYSLQ